MKLEVNKIYSGFAVRRAEYVEEINADAYLMEHEKSGARLLYLACDDDNKVFSISFRTPPADDTGVAHILEHSSLCGSRKYHLKEPFVELVKGSMNTFLNAMTYPDKTMYPVASRNDKDFKNLMDVYLDAVFYPLIYENPYTLLQEGWHYEIAAKDGELSYNGVVYNEMKGVYSSADAIAENEVMRALFPDTPYRFESGGYPAAIPGLTQEAFENFHRTYYSPENAFIYLYGDMDIKKTLAYLDSEYLSAFSKTGCVNSEIPMQLPFAKTKEVKAFYPAGADEDLNGKTYHELDIVCGDARDAKTSLALRLLETVLLEGNSAPLRLALLESGICKDAYGQYTGSLRQPVFAVKVSGSEEDKRDAFISIVYRTLQKLTIEGIDKELLEACLNMLEFKLREADFGAYPKGLIYGIGVMDTWLYDGDPLDGLRYNKMLAELRDGINTGYFESLIENYLLDNTHKVLLTLMPKKGMEEAEQAELAAKMEQIKAGMTDTELDEKIEQCRTLHERQATPDSPEALASIPLLKRSDIRRESEKLEGELSQEGSSEFLYVPAFTNKIAYLNWYFDMSGIDGALLPYCYLLSDMLGKVDAGKYTYQQLSTLGTKYTGGVAFQVHAYSAAESVNDYTVKFTVTAKALLHNLPHLFEILTAIATESRFDSKKRLREVLDEVKSDWDSNFFSRGQTVACARLNSYYSPAARVNEQDYYSYYEFLKALADDFDARADEVLQKLKALLGVFFANGRYLLAYSCEEADRSEVLQAAKEFAKKLPEAQDLGAVKPLAAPGLNEGIMTPGKVQYVAAGGDFRKFGHSFTGSMKVLETVLRYEYLWTKIRIQGGAYGASAVFDRNGSMYFASYRDPKLAETLEAYRGLPDWLEKLNLPERELTKYVIGTISAADVPLTNSMRLSQTALAHIKGVTQAMRQQTRDEVLNLTNDGLKQLGKVVRDVLSDNYLCVVGGSGAIEANKAVFTEIKHV